MIKNDRFWVVKKRAKNGQKLICHGGGPKWQKSSNFDLGDPGP
jgi:hypothetical protein